MKYIKSVKGWLLLAALVLLLGANTAQAAEFTVVPANATLFTGNGAEVFIQPDPTTIAAVFPGDFPVQVTGVTDNGYFQVNISGNTFYIYGKALSMSLGTQAYQLTSVDAKAALVGDADSGNLSYEQNAYARLAPASTTKIMTTLLVMDAIAAGQIALDTPVVVSPTALAGVPYDASHVKPRLKAGEVMNVYTLLQSVMMVSDCHACNVLAEVVAGSVDNFVALMNARAAALGCTETNFVNTSGYPDANHYSNAYSLFLITKEAMKYPLFQSIIAQKEFVIPPTNLTAQRELKTTNALIADSEYYNPHAIGGKTGSSQSSGSCFVAIARNDKKTVISVILGAATKTMSDGTRQKQQFAESNKLIGIGLAG